MKKAVKSIIIYAAIAAVVISLILLYQGSQEAEIEIVPLSTVMQELSKENVKEIIYNANELTITATLRSGKTIAAYSPSSLESSIIFESYIKPQAEKNVLEMGSPPPKRTPLILTMLPTIIMILIFVAFWVIFMQQGQGGGGGKVMSFGKSRAKLHKEEDMKKVTFADVAGLDEEKEELEEVVDFLRHPKKYIELGARIPKGILLVGPPGTGKTYLSKAAAGEAGVPFYTISGSDFVEMFVGVGASRVRDLFEQAKKTAPCIVFIDEIDAVGRKRGAGLGGGHDEREQTLNQLLVEMDGFGVNKGIIILAATNRPDILDPALLRPGRFDRQVVIGVPDIKGREEIFKIHARNKPLDESVDPKVLARRTPGFTPADIENLLNEAALLSARKNQKKIYMDVIEEATTKVIAGPEKKSRVISENERKLTAYHEAGHAVVARMLPNSDPVHQITIIPRGRMGGFTMILPKEDKSYTTKKDMESSIVHLLGGRVAEKLRLDDISTGASNDIERATEIAKSMVMKYGMSDRLGPVNYSSSDEVFLGKDFSTKKQFSEEVASEIDHEIRRMIEAAFVYAEELLSTNLDKLDIIADALLEVETLDGEQFEALLTGTKTVAQISEEMDVAAREKEAESAKQKIKLKKPSMKKEKVFNDIDEISKNNDFSANENIDILDEEDKIEDAEDKIENETIEKEAINELPEKEKEKIIDDSEILIEEDFKDESDEEEKK